MTFVSPAFSLLVPEALTAKKRGLFIPLIQSPTCAIGIPLGKVGATDISRKLLYRQTLFRLWHFKTDRHVVSSTRCQDLIPRSACLAARQGFNFQICTSANFQINVDFKPIRRKLDGFFSFRDLLKSTCVNWIHRQRLVHSIY